MNRSRYSKTSTPKYSNLQIFKNLPPEILSKFIIAPIARSCLYVCKTWYEYAITYIFHDRRLKLWKVLQGIVRANRLDLLQRMVRTVSINNIVLSYNFVDSVLPKVSVELIEFLVGKVNIDVDHCIIRSVKYNRADILKVMIPRSKDPRVPLRECITEREIPADSLRVILEYNGNGYTIDMNNSMIIHMLCENNMTDIFATILPAMTIGLCSHMLENLCLMYSDGCLDLLLQEFYVRRFESDSVHRMNLVPYIHRSIEVGNCIALKVFLRYKKDLRITRKKILELNRGRNQEQILEILGR